MIPFEFVSPTKLYFGPNKEKEVADIIASYGFNRVLVVIGQGSVIKSGLFDVVSNLLKEKGILFEGLSGVRPNPTIELCHKGIRLAKCFKPDMILALGGGSVIDTAKNVAVGYYYDGDSFDFNLHKAKPIKALPIGVILTISAAGSEMSSSCVIQDDNTGVKMGFNSDIVRPLFAIENPELTYSVNAKQTAYGVVDIMMHTLERYLQPSDNIEPADGFAEELLRDVVKAAYLVKNNPSSYEGRSILMLMSSLSHNDLTSLGKKKMMPVHQLEHVLSGKYPFVAHAAGLSVIFPKWARFYLSYNLEKFDKLAKNVFDLHNQDMKANANEGINKIEELFAFLEMPKTFDDLGIKDANINDLADALTNNGTRVIDHFGKSLDKEVATIIYHDCL